MRRTLRPIRLAKSPLVNVLAQVRFPPVLAIHEAVPLFQNRLRRDGFPRFRKSELQQVTLGPGTAKAETNPRWDFLDRDKTSVVTLTNDFVILQTNAYSRFEDFAERLTAVLALLSEFVEIDLVERIGLRYVDLVRPADGEDPALYLDAGLLGFPFGKLTNLATSKHVFRTESLATTEEGTLAVRCLRPDKPQYLPPDLMPSVLSFALNLGPSELPVILDFDHFSTRARDFRTDEVVDAVGDLHDAVDIAFRQAATEHAFRVWGLEGQS
jgi:uncharacterized protein (TIGR04255 family)